MSSDAAQIRNAHNLLQDMAEEADLYAKAGDLVMLLGSWRAASMKKLPELITEVAQLMTDTGFWEQVTCLPNWVHLESPVLPLFLQSSAFMISRFLA